MIKLLPFVLMLIFMAFGIVQFFFFTPSEFDLRKSSRVTSARTQAWGTCWAHGTIASMESNLLQTKLWQKEGESGDVDLSEYHMDKYNGFNRNGENGDKQKDWYSGQSKDFVGSNIDDLKNGLVVHLGGDYKMAAAHLSNSLGAVQESKTPKINHDHNDHKSFGNTKDSGVLLKNSYNYYFPRHIEWLSLEGSVEEKIQKTKSAIKIHGAVASAQYMEDKPLKITEDGLEIHMASGSEKLNHSIALIGWNDKIRYKDKVGAWLVKDSDHKNEKTEKHIGHFYVMYDDFFVAKDKYMGSVIFRDIALRDEKTKIYSHSLHGWRYTTDENFYEVANKYKATRKEKLDAIGFYTLKSNLNFVINVYIENKLIYSQKGKEALPGFHYHEFKRPIKLENGQSFKVALQYNQVGYAYDASFAMEVLLGKLPKWGEPVLVHSKASVGESMYRESQSSDWKDFSSYISKNNKQKDIEHALKNKTANFSINAYTIELN